MNIVKGVADLIRRTSGGHDGDSSSGTQAQKFSPPGLKICFSGVGDEAVLNILWDQYQKAVDKVEKRRLFHVFLKQFLDAYENWEPVNTGQMSEASSTTIHSTEYSSRSDDVVIGCFAGHPAEVILVLTEEIRQLTSMVAEFYQLPCILINLQKLMEKTEPFKQSANRKLKRWREEDNLQRKFKRQRSFIYNILTCRPQQRKAEKRKEKEKEKKKKKEDDGVLMMAF